MRYSIPRPLSFDEAHAMRRAIVAHERLHDASRGWSFCGPALTHLVDETVERLLAPDALQAPRAELVTAVWILDGVDHVDASRARETLLRHPDPSLRAIAAETTNPDAFPLGSSVESLGAAIDLPAHREPPGPTVDAWAALASAHPEARARAFHSLASDACVRLLPALLQDPVYRRILSRRPSLPREHITAIADTIEDPGLPARERVALATRALRSWAGEARRRRQRASAPEAGTLMGRLEQVLAAWEVAQDDPRSTASPPASVTVHRAEHALWRIVRAVARHGTVVLDYALPCGECEEWDRALRVAFGLHLVHGGPCAPRTFARFASQVQEAWTLPAVPLTLRRAALRATCVDLDVPPLSVDAGAALLADVATADADVAWDRVHEVLSATPVACRARVVVAGLPMARLDELIADPRWCAELPLHLEESTPRNAEIARRLLTRALGKGGSIEVALDVARVIDVAAWDALWEGGLGALYTAHVARAERKLSARPLSAARGRWLAARLVADAVASPDALVRLVDALATLRPGMAGPAMAAVHTLADEHPDLLLCAFRSLDASTWGAWCDMLLFAGTFPLAFETRVAPLARVCDDPRAQRYASAIEAPETVFPCGSTREAMRALHEQHEAERALERARRAAGSRASRAAASTLPLRPDGHGRGPQRRRSTEEIERQRGLLVRHAQERLRSGRGLRELRDVDTKERPQRGGHADVLPLRAVYLSLFGPTSRLPVAMREALSACTGDPILSLAEVEAQALIDSAVADRMAYAIVARYPIWHLSLSANRRAALLAHLARPSRGDVVDEPPSERAAAFLALFERALRAVPSGGWPALAHAVAGVKVIPDLLERIVRSMPDAELPSFLRWMRRLHPCHVAHARIDERISARVAAMPSSLVAAHRGWLAAWAGEVESSVLRGALAARLMGRDDRERALRQLMDLYRWTQRQALRLTGSRVGLEFVADETLGRAWTAERRIAVNVRPLLEGASEGRELVEAIVLHELGHIAWHADAPSRQVWSEAADTRVQKELNIVLDEQLERRLRGLDPRWGEQLHRLTAWVFGARVAPISVAALWDVLGPRALDPRFVAWATARRRACGDPRSLLASRSDLARAVRLVGCEDDSLGAFLRALRMGLGRQRMGTRGRRAAELFDRTLVDASPGDALRRASDLREIFRPEPWQRGSASERRRGDAPWDAVIGAPGDLDPTADAGPWGEGASSLGGISGQEVEVLVRHADARTAGTVGHASGGALGVRLLNDSASLDVPPLEVAPHVRADASAEAALLAQIAPQGRRLAQTLARLGSRTETQSGRLTGTRVDAGSAARRTGQRDPRMLTRRVRVRAPEFFLGLCVDASGSMRIHGRLERARQMAAMLWSAARALPGSICEVYSFNHHAIRPAFAGGETAFTRIVAGGGNNDAAALRYVAQRAEAQRRRVSLLVMLSDGSPTVCSVQALRNEATRLQREGHVVAQLSFRRGAPGVIPHQVEVDERREHEALQRFEGFVEQLATAAY